MDTDSRDMMIIVNNVHEIERDAIHVTAIVLCICMIILHYNRQRAYRYYHAYFISSTNTLPACIF